MTQISERAVLFADLRGSTSLYEALGNARASELVTRSVSLLAGIVSASGGAVVKTLGDGLMAVFSEPSSAIEAAVEMQEGIGRPGGVGTIPGAQGRRTALKLQVAIAYGELVELSGDCFGDAVNVAARLIDHAGDNETLVTSRLIDRLDRTDRARFRSLDKVQLKGRVEPVQVYLLDARRFSDTAVTLISDLTPVTEPEGVRLVWQNLNRVYAGASLPVVLGRSPQASFCIDDSRVSRSHARIDWHGGAFQLSDLSYNGTYVSFAGSPETVALRRGTCTLHGHGVISLGAPPQDASAAAVRFEIVKFSDTQPLVPPDFASSRSDDGQ